MKYVFAALLLFATATTVLAAPTATLTATAYVDLNRNGTQDANEPPAAGIDWVATDDRSVYHCITGATGACTLSLTPGRWYITAYHHFNMVYDNDVQLGDDLTVSAAIEPVAVYLPLVVK